jgi:osmotically-inducible protein OsmY
MGIEARVFGRIHWDKELQGNTIELEVRNSSEAILRGSVPSAAARSKAVALARDTVGVTRVIDELSVSPPAG